jgi:hypothetical protein
MAGTLSEVVGIDALDVEDTVSSAAGPVLDP